MMSYKGGLKPVSLKKVKTYSIKKRHSKVASSELAAVYTRGQSFSEFLKTLPPMLGASDLLTVASAVNTAKKQGKKVSIAMGAHVIKVGLGPLIIEMMEEGVIDSVAMNGACIVHDFELAFAGQTSEDVDKEIGSGRFGMAQETGRLINSAIKRGAKKGKGLGASVGEMIERSRYPNKGSSILAAGFRLGVPVTVHVAIGTDIIHMHPSMDGAATGKATELDFRLFTSVVKELGGGVFINIGSAVIMPEVFLKALTLARNLSRGKGKGRGSVKNLTCVNMDFQQHYRPVTNVVRRPTLAGGKGITLTGHHEIMVPLLFAAIKEGR